MLVGLAAVLVLFGSYFLELALGHTAKANHIWKIIGVHVSLGAGFGAMQGAKYTADLSICENILVNTLITISIIFIFYTLFNLSCRGLFRIHWLEKQFHSLTSNATTQKKTWVRFGIPGIFLFVLFPLTCTGPLVGAVLGRVIGLGYWTNLATVASGSVSTVIAFAFFGEWITKHVSTLALTIIIVVALILVGLVKLIDWRKQRQQTTQEQP
jgi:uncharacterized membrane protein